MLWTYTILLPKYSENPGGGGRRIVFSGAALESMVGKPAESMGPGDPFKTQNSPTAAPPNQVSYSYKPSEDMNACAI